jgi:tetratricopeptide (TPR) repeat protein
LLTVFGSGAVAVLVEHVRARRFSLPAASLLLASALTAAFWPRGPVGLGGEWTVFRPVEYLNNAAVLMKEGREAEALVLLEDGHTLFPRKPEFAERLAYLYLETGRPQAAVAVTEQALARGVVTQRILERRVLAYKAQSQWDKARAAAADLAARYPDSELARKPTMPPR